MEQSDQAASMESRIPLESVSQEPTSLQVEQALSAVLASPTISVSKQSQRLLQYLVEQALQGQDEMLKERIVGIKVFGRGANYNTGDDPIVRVRAADLRKRLTQYYTNEGMDDPVKIQIPPGSYHPVFVASAQHESLDRAKEGAQGTRPPAPFDAVSSDTPASIRAAAARRLSLLLRHHYLAIGAALCLLALLADGLVHRMQKTAADLFWEPVLNSSEPVLIFFGNNAVYVLSDEVQYAYPTTRDVALPGREFFVDFPAGTKIDAKDLIRANDFVKINDFAAAAEVITFLKGRGKSFELRWGHDISTGDFWHAPVILIGAYNNYLTLELIGKLRYQFAEGLQIKDRDDPKRLWVPTHDAKGIWFDDYAIVSRVIQPKTGAIIITAAGLGQNGTQGAGEFLNSPQQIANAVKGQPPDWNKKNMQILLHVKSSSGPKAGYNAPYSTDVVAVYLW